jgi:hypothetical protein
LLQLDLDALPAQFSCPEIDFKDAETDDLEFGLTRGVHGG